MPKACHGGRVLNFRVNLPPGALMFRPVLVWMLLLAWLTVNAIAQSPDVPEPGSVEAIAAATTDPHFVSPWVSYIPHSDSVPSPEKFLGRIMGAPGELLGTEKTRSEEHTSELQSRQYL